MVKKTMILFGILLVGSLTAFTGCNQANPPVYPKDSASLVLSFPVPKPSSPKPSVLKPGVPKKTSAVDLSNGLFEYNISNGTESYPGSVTISSSVTMGTVSISLPHNGTWLVSGEWFDYGTTPRFVGAEQVAVDGLTNVLLEMGDISTSACSYNYLADTNNCDTSYYGDLFTFDSNMQAFSTIGGSIGDIQVTYDNTNSTEVMSAYSGGPAVFAYLGTGDWVNYTNIPTGTIYYPNSESAKAAVVGQAAATLALNDVYAIQMSSSYHVWMQMTYAPYYCAVTTMTGGLIYFSYRVNSQGYTYMNYDETTYDKANCVNMTYYPGGG